MDILTFVNWVEMRTKQLPELWWGQYDSIKTEIQSVFMFYQEVLPLQMREQLREEYAKLIEEFDKVCEEQTKIQIDEENKDEEEAEEVQTDEQPANYGE